MPGETVDVAYRLTENQWNGTTSVELKIADLHLAENFRLTSQTAARITDPKRAAW
jgi:hypothetical protein